MFEKKFLKLCFLPGKASGTTWSLPPPFPTWSKLCQVNLSVKTYATDMRTTEAHYSFQLSFKIVLPLLPQNEIQLLSNFFCFSKLVCLFGLGLRKASPRDSTELKVEHAHLIAFRSCTQGEPEYILQFLSRFRFVVTSGVIISYKRDHSLLFHFMTCNKHLRQRDDLYGLAFSFLMANGKRKVLENTQF